MSNIPIYMLVCTSFKFCQITLINTRVWKQINVVLYLLIFSDISDSDSVNVTEHLRQITC